MTNALLVETVDRLLREQCDHSAVQRAEVEGWAPKLWDALSAAGLPWVSIPEGSGGAGGELLDALEVLQRAGYYGAPAPLAETGVLGGWLLAGAGLAVPEGPVTVVPTTSLLALERAEKNSLRLRGTAQGVPWAAACERIVAVLAVDEEWMVVSVKPSAGSVTSHTNLAGEPRDSVSFDYVLGSEEVAPAGPGVDADALFLRGALSRVMLMAGALQRASDLTIQYTSVRRQFGRPVNRFQAVQQHLVNGAQDSALVNLAAAVAASAANRGEASFEIGAAKLLANQAANTSCSSAHQAHGAMGCTQEYSLHQVTRRLWAWRREYGADDVWALRTGSVAVDHGADGLYPLITSGSHVLRSVS